MEKIVYKYKTRSEVIYDQMLNTLNAVYALSYPKSEKSFEDMCKYITEEAIKQGKQHDCNFRLTYGDKGQYMWPCDFFYMPHKVLKEIWDNRQEAYGIEEHWREDITELIKFLFETPGFKEVYGPTKWSDGESIRHCEDLALLDKYIDKDAAEKVKEIITEYKNTYRWGLTDVNQFCAGFLSTPSSNRETVIKAWKEAFGKDIEIPDDSVWVDEYYEEEDDEEDV